LRLLRRARVSDYADDNTAIVAVAALAIGLLVGYGAATAALTARS
jgi:hypothetical protein